MSEIIEIKSSSGTYEVIIGEELLNIDGKVCLIDSNLIDLYPELKSAGNIVTVTADENEKTLIGAARIIEDFRGVGVNKKTALHIIGGGITQDIGTFIASVFMRGVTWSLAPTTLLSMVDSCIGGKSSINVGPYKNIAGNFYPPEKIIIDSKFCTTLSEKQLVEGLSEAVKICYAHSESAFENYLSIVSDKDDISKIDFKKICLLSLGCKKEFIEADEFDTGVRLLLNFGHTFGHAIESSTRYKISHGVAVALGMLCAKKYSEIIGVHNPKNERATLLENYIFDLLKRIKGLSNILKDMDVFETYRAFQSDKKHDDENYHMILFSKEGALFRSKQEKNSSNKEAIEESFHYIKKVFGNEVQ